MRLFRCAAFCLASACALVVAPARAGNPTDALAVPPSGVIGLDNDAMLTPAFWIGQLPQPDQVLLDSAAITAQNARLLQLDPSMHDLRTLPSTLTRAQVQGWINQVSQLPQRPLYDENGARVPASVTALATDQLALDRVAETQGTRYGLVVRRAPFRSFPTDARVFTSDDDADIDRFQETAEFPGTPVAIVHASRDGQWLFVLSARYAAWTRKENVGEGSVQQVFAYAGRLPQRVVTGAVVETVHTRERPAVSQLRLDMGTAVPVLPDHPADQPVNGQSPYAAYVIDLPLRTASGALGFTPALVRRQADTSESYLPLTEGNIIRQAFKFLGERYGWGHDYDGRDCSGFVSDVYRSMGVQMPRDTGRQAGSPVLAHRSFSARDSHDARMQAVRELKVGELVYIPGHVMMVIGRVNGEPYVIHDTTGISYRDGSGGTRQVKLNAVSVTPLLPLMLDGGHSYVDRMTSIVHIRS
ncbi:C40 family peptidase [Dyella soli]|uniref:NlpC-P60 family protein n=1 Tax=Dyella soli TaxID=522319 RepID=A0A4R0YMY9_9GAMM|nr:SH3 domain-containing protein [Dyella soli]TCI07169.1 NlpC-P60 family protein [Dyella soli]